MQEKQNLITLAFVLVVGLLGGYMIAQHVGHAADSHHEMQEMKERDGMDDHHAMPPAGDMPAPAPEMDGGMPDGADADVRVQ